MRAIVVVLLLLGWGAPALAGLEFTFPPGWRDLSVRAKPNDMQGVPQAVRDAFDKLRDPRFTLAAIDFEALKNASMAVVLATKAPNAEPLNKDAIERYEPVFQQAMLDGLRGGGCSLLELDMTKIHDIPCGRLVYSLTANNLNFRALMYIIPGGDEVGAIMFLCDPNVYAARVGFFDALAQSTQGVRPVLVPRQPAAAAGSGPIDPVQLAAYTFLIVAVGYGVTTLRAPSDQPEDEAGS